MAAEIINPQGRVMSSVTLGARVVLKGDIESPVMTTIAPILPPNSDQVVGWVCGWFNTTFAEGPDGLTTNKTWNQMQLSIKCLELAQETVN